MTLEEAYEVTGSDYKEIMECLGNEAMVRKYAFKFLDDDSFDKLCKATEEDNREEAFRASHTIKGLATNLCFTRLREKASELTEQLRSREESADPVLFTNLKNAYEELVFALRECE